MGSVSGNCEAVKRNLALYLRPACGYCARVVAAIDRLGIDVELRDIWADARHREVLIAACGDSRVPVLRIVGTDGSELWMPESRDIIRHLEALSGN